ncbi:MAG: outer membrane beta-barrel protein [Pseudomonas sp.]|nr:outer membrane beta-barrel protein [Pseudomonas sp.]
MTLKRMNAALLASLMAATACPAEAQEVADWNGFYLGGNLGSSEPIDSDNDRIVFDTNQDGQFGDTVRTVGGADAFSPGFCGGAANARRPTDGCREDKGGADYGLRAGYDWQIDRWVFGVVAEYTQGDARDSASAFSITPAFYYFTRDLDTTTALRARVGYAFGERGDWLAYTTAGVVRAEIEQEFETSNTANSFTPTMGSTDADGYQAGIGIERKVLDNLSLGLEYLYTNVKDDDFDVRVGRGNAPATSPFLTASPDGTDFRRSEEDFKVGSLRLTATFRF